MKNKKWNIIVYLHAFLLLWFLLFLCSLFMPDGGKIARVLAVGNFLFLFADIPFALFSFVMKAKDCFSTQYEIPIVVLSILNIIAGIVMWLFVVLLLQTP